MQITMLGTGNALVTECYNTCFVIHNGAKKVLIDGGGGSALLSQLKRVDIAVRDIHDIIVTHRHIDHIMGIVWMIRIVAQSMNKNGYDGDLRIYAHKELCELIRELCSMLLQAKQTKYIDDRIHIIEVQDGERVSIVEREFTFFDIHSTKTKQYGFCMMLENGEKLTCCGDEPCNPVVESYVKDSKWLLHEAFCLFEQADKYHPYEKNHSTVKDACELAERLGVKNLLLYHTEDDNIRMRKSLYGAEGSQYFHGRILIPDDLETVCL